jgi:hypothetical protein
MDFSEAAALEMAGEIAGTDRIKAMAAFMEKRPAKFSGRENPPTLLARGHVIPQGSRR